MACEHARIAKAGELAINTLLNIFWLGLKEFRSLASDIVMVIFVVYAFTGAIYAQATGTSSEVRNASIAFVDEDGSALSKELMNAFYPPRFQRPDIISVSEVETAMDEGRYMFVVVIPPQFELDQRAGRHPDIQLNIDATAMTQAAIGSGYIKNIINDRVSSFFRRTGQIRRAAGQFDHSPLVQSQWRILLVHERRRHHQPNNSHNRHFDGSRRDPRA